MTDTQFPFKTPTAAIVHAFNDERHGGARPASARLADKRLADVPEFGGSDGGAEKATALDMLTKGLTKLQLAALRARYAPRQRRCPCCNQQVPREDWQAALRELAGAASPTVDMPSIRGPLLAALIQRYYEGNTPGLEQLAGNHGVSLSSVSRANSLVVPWLRGARKTKSDTAPIQGVEQIAFERAEGILRGGGFIE
ncbi:hypothetical protein CAL29_28155 [Bordetella genomosp. 10]|uniref:Uncharacterized protein n=1 Tax=Bordetella genomosp. 10 TaxID=1416804 RepID=A0A261S424_9BORD|nr:hypothetical protein [Bordetella genomosp. 10]OZI31747.1 hypothetical protein CAL29_28155 [Bordetella genomosp. 10]